jgi:hypothetical protein
MARLRGFLLINVLPSTHHSGQEMEFASKAMP